MMRCKMVLMMCVLSICASGAIANMVVNGDFETGDLTGWTTDLGDPYVVADGEWGINGIDAYWCIMGASEEGQISQTFDVSADAAAIDTGGIYAIVSAALSSWANSDIAEVTVSFLDGADVDLGSPLFLTALDNPTLDLEHADSQESANGLIPVGTRTIELKVYSLRTAGGDNDGYVDNVSLTLEMDKAILISPADGQTGVPVETDDIADTPEAITNTTLTWGPPPGYIGAEYNVYFGTTEPNYLEADYGLTLLNISGPTTDTAVDPDPSSDLEYGTWYYWVVDSYEPNGVDPILHRGSPWSFKTVEEDPVPDQQPQDAAAFPTESASFTATASSLSPLNYQWKKVTAGGDVDVPGGTASTLVITDIEIADEAFYYCQFTNDSGNPVNSDSALLTVKRKLVHLPLNGDTLAGTGTAINGIENGDLEWVTGISGSAVNLTQDNADPNILDYIKLADDANDLLFAERTNFTVSIWVQSPGAWSADPAIISNKDWYSGSNVGWAIAAESGGDSWQWNYDTADADRDDYDPATLDITDGQWHHILISHDRDGDATFYFDGSQTATEDISNHTGTIDAGLPTVIGTGGDEGTAWPYGFVGAIDEVEIWNYTMNRVEVATMYTDLAGGWVCVADQENPDASSIMDFNADCKVDLVDFAAFALEWMDCNRVPAADCDL